MRDHLLRKTFTLHQYVIKIPFRRSLRQGFDISGLRSFALLFCTSLFDELTTRRDCLTHQSQARSNVVVALLSRAVACRAGRRPTLATRHFMDAAPAIPCQSTARLRIALPMKPAGDGPAAFGRASGLDADENNHWLANQTKRCRALQQKTFNLNHRGIKIPFSRRLRQGFDA